MCRSIKQLRRPEPADETEIREAALQFVRKVSGYRTPSKRNAEAFEAAVDEVAESTRRLLDVVARASATAARSREPRSAVEDARSSSSI